MEEILRERGGDLGRGGEIIWRIFGVTGKNRQRQEQAFVGRKGRTVVVGRSPSGSFDCVTHDKAVSHSAQDDNFAGLVGGGGMVAGMDFFKEPGDGEAEEAEQAERAEDVDEGPEGGLAVEFAVEQGLGGVEGVGWTEGVGECVAGGGE